MTDRASFPAVELRRGPGRVHVGAQHALFSPPARPGRDRPAAGYPPRTNEAEPQFIKLRDRAGQPFPRRAEVIGRGWKQSVNRHGIRTPFSG